jgi:hypothetical protein
VYIRSGAFARRFQVEASGGYPMLEIARGMIDGPSLIGTAEERLRRLKRLERPAADAVGGSADHGAAAPRP